MRFKSLDIEIPRSSSAAELYSVGPSQNWKGAQAKSIINLPHPRIIVQLEKMPDKICSL
jgi:hypothetical protein